MAHTFYDSELTAAEIEAALEAIDGVITQANNGKVLAIEDGGIVAKNVSEYTDTAVLVPKSITANGNYNPASDDADGYSSVAVNVPNSYSAGDEGKVVSNGALVAQTAHAEVTQNGTYDTTLNDEVTVNVSGGGSAVIEPLSVTQNGTYTAPSGVDGYSPITVNVSGGGGNPYSGTGIPSSSLGSDGDTYFRYKLRHGYVYADGSTYVNTGYIHKANTKIVCYCKVKENTQRNYEAIFGARSGSSGSKSMILFTRMNGSNVPCVARSGSETRGTSFPYGEDITITFEGATVTWTDERGVSTSLTPSTYNIDDGICPMFIFDLNKSTTAGGTSADGSRCVAYLYEFQIFESDVLVADFVPYNDNGTWTLKDSVSGNLATVPLGTLSGNDQDVYVVFETYVKSNGAWTFYQ